MSKKAAFRRWQLRPYRVAPLSDTEHHCATCGTEYRGNYCPRCGQPSKIGRYSFKTALLLFLDVWGLGNRGMFRSIRDLLLRPGYMIRDYLSGMQMAYFPPFKMFFLLIAFNVLVDSGVNIFHENRMKNGKQTLLDGLKMSLSDEPQDDVVAEKINNAAVRIGAGAAKLKGTIDSASVANKDDAEVADAVTRIVDSTVVAINEDKELTPEERKMNEKAKKLAGSYRKKVASVSRAVINWIDEHQNLVQFVWLIVLSVPLFLFFRKCPALPDIRYSEFFVAMVYTTNMMTLISTIGGFFCLPSGLVEPCTYLLSVVPLKQFTGYKYKQTLWRIIAAFAILGILAVILIAVVVGSIVVWFTS